MAPHRVKLAFTGKQGVTALKNPIALLLILLESYLPKSETKFILKNENKNSCSKQVLTLYPIHYI